jgi:protein required for attachment to host cells
MTLLIPKETLVLVADGEKFLLLRNAGSAHEPLLMFEGGGEKENPATQEQGTDQPGRFAGVGSARSASEPTDFHQLGEDRFAADIADHLARLAEAGDYQALVVVAPPRTLAVLRKRFGRAVHERIVAEIGKDLTNHPVSEIAAILGRDGD